MAAIVADAAATAAVLATNFVAGLLPATLIESLRVQVMARRLCFIEKRITSPNGTDNTEGELHGETSIRRGQASR